MDIAAKVVNTPRNTGLSSPSYIQCMKFLRTLKTNILNNAITVKYKIALIIIYNVIV